MAVVCIEEKREAMRDSLSSVSPPSADAPHLHSSLDIQETLAKEAQEVFLCRN